MRERSVRKTRRDVCSCVGVRRAARRRVRTSGLVLYDAFPAPYDVGACSDLLWLALTGIRACAITQRRKGQFPLHRVRVGERLALPACQNARFPTRRSAHSTNANGRGRYTDSWIGRGCCAERVRPAPDSGMGPLEWRPFRVWRPRRPSVRREFSCCILLAVWSSSEYIWRIHPPSNAVVESAGKCVCVRTGHLGEIAR